MTLFLSIFGRIMQWIKVTFIFISFGLLTQLAEAKVYKWKDSNGQWQYSDIRPVNVETQTMRTQRHKKKVTAKKIEKENPIDGKSSNNQLMVDAENAAILKQNCNGAKANLIAYANGGRIRRANKNGEMTFLSDAEIATAKAKAQKQVAQYCR